MPRIRLSSQHHPEAVGLEHLHLHNGQCSECFGCQLLVVSQRIEAEQSKDLLPNFKLRHYPGIDIHLS